MSEVGYVVSDRGFRHYEPIRTDYGHEVRVYESSAAMEPCLWLALELTDEAAADAHSGIAPEAATAHLTIGQATAVRDALSAAIDGHYQRR